MSFNEKIGKNSLFFIKKLEPFLIIAIFILISRKLKNDNILRLHKHFINICRKSVKLYNEGKKINKFPFFSICIPVFNMEKYIEMSLLSVLNQSFRDFEIIIINDYSLDNSKKIIEKMQSKNYQIRLINHERNLGVYESRIDAVRNAKGNYIIFLDPDDLFSNQNLLKDLFKYNNDYNVDILEFTVLIHEEILNILYYPLESRRNHFHNFGQQIIHHPFLSNILFYEKNNSVYKIFLIFQIYELIF